MKHSLSLMLFLFLVTGCTQTVESNDATGFYCEKREFGMVEVRELILDETGTIKKLISTSLIEFDIEETTDITIEEYQAFLAKLYDNLVSQDDGINFSSNVNDNAVEVVMTFDMNQISNDTLIWLGMPISNSGNRIVVQQYIDNLVSNGYICKPQ